MYTGLKSIVKTILPRKVLYVLMPKLRAAYSLLYTGNKVHCSICEGNFRKFILLLESGDALCPKCGSLPRKRLLWKYLTKEVQIKSKNVSVLHFSPNQCLSSALRKLPNIRYLTTDYESPYKGQQYDITDISEPDESFDLVICYHVLEHIPDDQKAMQELFRVLKSGGLLIAQTPFRNGPTLEDNNITTPKDRKEFFGQEDHVRYYGLSDFVSRLEKCGFDASAIPFASSLDQQVIIKEGLNPDENIVVGKKPN